MEIVIHGFSGAPIQAIRGIRAVTGLGLREAKVVIDAVALSGYDASGTFHVRNSVPQAVTVKPGLTQTDVERHLSEALIHFEVRTKPSFIGALRRYLNTLPAHLTVGDLRDVLGVLDRLED